VRPAPAVVGDGLDAVQTPALILDKDALLANLRRLPALLRESSTQVRIRPHFKAHKCGAIAQLQLEEGEASGFCFQKVSELEGLVRHFEQQQAAEAARAGEQRRGGWQLDLLVTNEVVERSKLRRLCELARHPEVARVGVAVDDVGVLDVLMEEAHRTPSGAARVGVVIEIDVGQQRCGIDVASAEGQTAFVELARRLMAAHRDPSGRVSFIGLQAYHGGAVLRTNVCVCVCVCASSPIVPSGNQHVRAAADRERTVQHVAALAQKALDLLKVSVCAHVCIPCSYPPTHTVIDVCSFSLRQTTACPRASSSCLAEARGASCTRSPPVSTTRSNPYRSIDSLPFAREPLLLSKLRPDE
jgi:hypothetical protein